MVEIHVEDQVVRVSVCCVDCGQVVYSKWLSYANGTHEIQVGHCPDCTPAMQGRAYKAGYEAAEKFLENR